MPIPSERGSFGPHGKAQVAVNKDQKTKDVINISVSFEGGSSFTVQPEDAPDYLKQTGNYNVLMDKNGQRIYIISPIGGEHVFKFAGFKPSKDENGDAMPPKPELDQGGLKFKRDGTQYYEEPFLKFTALFEIVGGDYNGFPLRKVMPYPFKQYSRDPRLTAIGGKGSELVREFLGKFGIDPVVDSLPTIQSPEFNNILPELEQMLFDSGKIYFSGSLNEDGWIDSYSPLPPQLLEAVLNPKK
jgi:hypothetical protein